MNVTIDVWPAPLYCDNPWEWHTTLRYDRGKSKTFRALPSQWGDFDIVEVKP